MPTICEEHSAHVVRIAELEKQQDKQWKIIDLIKTWVILGMGGLLIQCFFFIITYVKKG